jgi:hypothetical protein
MNHLDFSNLDVGDIAGFARWCANRVAHLRDGYALARRADEAAAEAAGTSNINQAILAAEKAATRAEAAVFEDSFYGALETDMSSGCADFVATAARCAERDEQRNHLAHLRRQSYANCEQPPP